MDPSSTRRILAAIFVSAAFVHLGGLPKARAEDWLTGPTEPPLHPTILRSSRDGHYYPIVAVKNDRAEIEVDGKLSRVDPRDGYDPARARAYAKGYVQFSTQNASWQVRTMNYRLSNGSEVPGGTLTKNGTYEATLLPSESHDDCYIAVIFYQLDAAGEPKAGTVAMAFGQVGTLTAGKPSKISIDEAYIPGEGVKFYCFPLLFSKGVEIRTDQSELAARFFRWQEMNTHRKILAAYLQQNPTANLQPQAYLRVPPVLPENVDVKTLPAVIHTSFMVSETGEVESLQVEDPVDPPVFEAIRRAINGWLFTPKLENGRPTRIMIRLPLSFDPARS
jgi:hypothetical protein